MVVLGYMTALLGVVSKKAVKQAVCEHVPQGTEDKSIEAFEEGYKSGTAR